MHHVRYFLALSEEQNFTRAARRCRVSQPTLTNAIKALEKEMGSELFSRSPVTRITDLGLAIKPYFEEILLNVEHARKCAQSFNGGEIIPTSKPLTASLS